MDIKREFSTAIRLLKTEGGFTTWRAFGERAKLKPSSMSDFNHGRQSPGDETIAKIARAAGFEPDEVRRLIGLLLAYGLEDGVERWRELRKQEAEALMISELLSESFESDDEEIRLAIRDLAKARAAAQSASEELDRLLSHIDRAYRSLQIHYQRKQPPA